MLIFMIHVYLIFMIHVYCVINHALYLQIQYFSNFTVKQGQFVGFHYDSTATKGVLQYTKADGSGIESLQTYGHNPNADIFNHQLNEGSYFGASRFPNARRLPMAYFQITSNGKKHAISHICKLF